eukprot:TRINITY_DN50216_c0_g1_i1.p2 TRINITY_DN50216_c0_g1~~TRINITY_DN50216_c0_g1_i1.p2  ORF type:complete len:809 (+),score=235.59 TRINITY_DN50216_c0_g1_i1:2079-4505(+)
MRFERAVTTECSLTRQLRERALNEARQSGERLAEIASAAAVAAGGTQLSPLRKRLPADGAKTAAGCCMVTLCFSGADADHRVAALLAALPPRVAGPVGAPGGGGPEVICAGRAEGADAPRLQLVRQLTADSTAMCGAAVQQRGGLFGREGACAWEMLRQAVRLGARLPFPGAEQAALLEAIGDRMIGDAEEVARDADSAVRALCEEICIPALSPLHVFTLHLFGYRRAFACPARARESTLKELADLLRMLGEKDAVGALKCAGSWELDEVSSYDTSEWLPATREFLDHVNGFLSSVSGEGKGVHEARKAELSEAVAAVDWHLARRVLLQWDVSGLEALSARCGMSVSAALGVTKPLEEMRARTCAALLRAALCAADFREVLHSVIGWPRAASLVDAARTLCCSRGPGGAGSFAALRQSSAQRLFSAALRMVEQRPSPGTVHWSGAFALLELSGMLGGARDVTAQNRQDLAVLALACAQAGAVQDARALCAAAPGACTPALFDVAISAAASPRHPGVTSGEAADAIKEAASSGHAAPALVAACSAGRVLLAALLLDHLHNPLEPGAGGQLPVQLAASHSAFSSAECAVVIRRLAQSAGLTQRESGAALLAAARKGSPLAVSALVEEGADPLVHDEDGTVPLMHAAPLKEFECDAGQPAFSALAVPAALAARNKEGDTALHLAARAGRVGTARLLVGLGAKPALQGRDKRTAMHLACNTDAFERGGDEGALVVGMLATAETVKAADTKGRTPLHIAAFFKRERICAALLQAGADPRLADSSGHTAAAVAERQGHLVLAQTLRDAEQSAKQ